MKKKLALYIQWMYNISVRLYFDNCIQRHGVGGIPRPRPKGLMKAKQGLETDVRDDLLNGAQSAFEMQRAAILRRVHTRQQEQGAIDAR